MVPYRSNSGIYVQHFTLFVASRHHWYMSFSFSLTPRIIYTYIPHTLLYTSVRSYTHKIVCSFLGISHVLLLLLRIQNCYHFYCHTVFFRSTNTLIIALDSLPMPPFTTAIPDPPTVDNQGGTCCVRGYKLTRIRA